MEYKEEIKVALDYIEHHLEEEIHVEEAAAAAGFLPEPLRINTIWV